MPTLYLLKQGLTANPLFNNHWALLVARPNTPPPESGSEPDLAGTFLHVHGSVAAGFAFEAKRGWARRACPEAYRAFVLGEVAPGSALITDGGKDEGEDGDGDGTPIPMPEPDESEHGWILDPAPRTGLERALLREPPPPPSLRSFDAGGVGAGAGAGAAAARGSAGRARLHDCQEWIRLALPHAVQAGILVYDETVDVDELLSVYNQ